VPRKKESEEVSIEDLAKAGLDRIVKLSQSQLISEKLQSLNILWFVFILTAYITHALGGSSTTSLSLLVIIVISFLFALIASLGYGPILSIVSNVTTSKIEGLRVGMIILFVSLTLGVAALVLDIWFLGNLSLGLIGLQLVIIPLGSFLVPRISIRDEEVDPSQVWTALGRISSVIGIINFIIDIVLILITRGV
jgi:hypothetical protein